MHSTKTLSFPKQSIQWRFKKIPLHTVIPFLPLAWQVICFIAPIGVLCISAFRSGDAWTIHHFLTLTEFPIISLLMNSLFLSITTTLLCLLLGFMIAYTLAFTIKKRKKFFLFLMFLPLWTNFLLHVCSWLLIFNKQGIFFQIAHSFSVSMPSLIHSYTTILVMMVYFYLPLTIIVLYNALSSIAPKVIDAAHDLGAGLFQKLKTILLPSISKAIKTAFFLVFLPSFGEFVIPELMGGNKFLFIGNLLASLLTTSTTLPIGCALTIITLLFLGVVSLCIHTLLTKLFSIGRSWKS
jgi:spermidine/putrescine transport system permease protein